MKAVVLYSGGLDSCLVLSIVRGWRVEVLPLHISHKFLVIKSLPEVSNLKITDISEEFIEVVRNPRFGYGKNLNPCIDCRILMLKKAKEYMNEMKADFVVTGEVLEQRPMSQRFETLFLIEQESGLEGLIVRPLSGGLLPPTIPENKGLINREKLLKLKGRRRNFEFALAKKMNITQYFSPSGGCLLTDPGFSKRLADLMRYQEKINIGDIELLKLGRHFRLAPDTKVIVGRNNDENEKLEAFVSPERIFISVPDTGSPNAIFIGDKKYLNIAAEVTARYSDKRNEKSVEVWYQEKKKVHKLSVKPMTDDELIKWRI